VLNPPRLGKYLLEFTLRYRRNGTFVIEQDGARTGGALIESQNVLQSAS
jgi:hypothetical protein